MSFSPLGCLGAAEMSFSPLVCWAGPFGFIGPILQDPFAVLWANFRESLLLALVLGPGLEKCICLVSRSPSFGILRTALEELFALCFSPAGSSKPLWDVILYMVSDVPLPTPGKDLVLFAIENCLLSVEAPPKDGLPHVEVPDYILIALNSASTLLCYAYKNDAVNFS
ncbi:C-MYC PROMOTER BINDING PROTEIN [Salix koriyanagi]|uniref:C-MYC PROMOTER BINDING PROTEIN n=1 Tax=Salix koriyanagi TaxID=2511006 RepID=A0A9Q0PND8_9ROSI|nr:C-MYC PROMOTER BINDING PROTEIN [Salix koriyanagi]